MKVVLGALISALGTMLACWRVVLLLWVLNAVVAWVVSAPLTGAIESAYLHNPLSKGLLAAFDNESWVDFENVQAGALDATAGNARAAALPWILLWWFLSAGVLLRAADKLKFTGFLSGCARYAHRFLWLLIITFAALVGIAWVNDRASEAATWLFTDVFDYGAGTATLGWGTTLKTLAMLGLVGLVVHTGRLARLRAVKLDERFMPATWLAAFAMLLRRLPHVLVGGLLSLVPLALVLWGYADATSGLFTDGTFAGPQASWRYLLIAQSAQLLIQAALVYRFAVDARMWPLFAPPPAAPPAAPQPAAGAVPEVPADQPPTDSPSGPDAEPAATEAAPESNGKGGPAALALLLAASVAVLAWNPLASAPQEAAAPQEAPVAQDAPQETPPADPAPPAPPTPPPVPATPADLSEHRNAYVMDVSLDIESATADVRQRATFLNTTDTAVDELWMHLYAAAFSNTRSTWMREGGPEPIMRRGQDEGGYIDVRSVRVSAMTGDEGPLPAGEATIDDTLMRIALDRPVPPGGGITLDVEFETRFPHQIARMGKVGRHIDGMQWYPKFAVHGDDGWVLNQFHRRGEFFADFGSYDVTFHFPAGVELEATGLPGNVRPETDGTQTVRYVARDVHDYAFCADPNAIRIEDRYVELAPERREIEIVYLCQPYALPKADQVIALVKSCLEFAGNYWMPYPYDRIVIDGLPHSLGGGMEYPMLFTISQREPNHMGWWVDLNTRPAHVTAHEFGHQYWYGIMASNEFAEAWLDEGLNTWGTNKLLDHHFTERGQAEATSFIGRLMVLALLNGRHTADLHVWPRPASLAHLVGWRVTPFRRTPPDAPLKKPLLLGWSVPGPTHLRLAGMNENRSAWEKQRYFEDARALPLSAPSRDFWRGYGSLVYSKTGLILQTLENHIGFEAMQEVMRTYVERWRFKHPTGEDFLAVVSEKTGGVHDGWLRQLLTTNGTVDFTVEKVQTRRDTDAVGYSTQTRPGDPVLWTGSDGQPDRDDGESLDLLARWMDVEPPAPEPGEWLSRFVVRQLGEIEAPVTVEARFAEGEAVRTEWDGRGDYRIVEHRSNSPLVEVVVDPERRFIIDLDVNNNGYRRQPDRATARTLRFLSHYWTQHALNAWSLFF